jgi:hypothetical protein
MSKRPSKPIAKYAVVERGYLEEETGGVLVPASQVRHQHHRRRREPMIRFGEDMPDDCDEGRDLGVVHGAVDGRIFADEVEEEFDQDFIMQMMTGEGVEGEDVGLLEEVAPELADEQYPRHEERRAEEKQFDKMMREFLMDEDIEEDDPRVHGALPVEEFYRPMQEFLQDHAGYSMLHEGEFVRHAGLINHFKLRADRNDTEEVAPDGTTFVAMPEKHSDPAGDFFRQTEGLQEITRRMLREGRLREDQVTIAQAVGEVMERVIGPDGSVTQAYYDDAEWLEDDGKGQRRPAFSVAPDAPQVVRDAARNFARRGDRMDCETVLTTMTDIYNRPNVITTGASVRATTVRSKAPAAYAPGLLEAANRKPAVAAASVAAAPKAAPSAIAPSAKRAVVIAPGEILPRGPIAPAAPIAMDDDDLDLDGLEGASDMDGAGDLTLQEQLLMLSVVPKGETKEEKKQRQQLVKQLQRERRAAKKELRSLYATTEVSQKSQAKQSKNDKATTKMSAI